MQRCKGSIRRLVKNESGHMLAFEWSYLLIVFLVLVSMLLPDLIMIGRTMFHTHSASAYAIQRVAEQGQMTDEITSDVVDYLADRKVPKFEVYGTGEMTGINEDDPTVKVQIISRIKPKILAVLPSFRVNNNLSLADGEVVISFEKIDTSSVYVR